MLVDAIHLDRHFGMHHDPLQAFGDVEAQFLRCKAGRLDLPDQRNGHFAVRTHDKLARIVRLVPDPDGNDVFGADHVGLRIDWRRGGERLGVRGRYGGCLAVSGLVRDSLGRRRLLLRSGLLSGQHPA